VRRLGAGIAIVAIGAAIGLGAGCGGSSQSAARTPANAPTITNTATLTGAAGVTAAAGSRTSGGSDGSGAASGSSSGGAAAAPAGDAAAGKTFFVATCQGCHANLGNTAGFGPKLAGLGLAEQRIHDQVVNGGGGMPPGLAQGKDLDNVVAYVLSIQ
jgi:mono/diheme cytochrome c family protein